MGKEEQKAMDEALRDLLSIFEKPHAGKSAPDRKKGIDGALQEVLRFWKIEAGEVPDKIEDPYERVEYVLRPTGVMHRRVELTGKWWKDATGPLLGAKKDGTPVALLPMAFGGYAYHDENGKVRINEKTAGELLEQALCFYRGFPAKPLKLIDTLMFRLHSFSVGDVIWVLVASLCVSLLGMVLPQINKLIFDNIIPGGLTADVFPVTALLVGATVGSLLFGISRSLILRRFMDKMSVASQNAVMSRVFSLPVSFFKDYSAGELSERVGSMNAIGEILSGTVLTTGLSALFSFVYIFQMASFAPALVGPGMLVIAAMLAVIVLTAIVQIHVSKRKTDISIKLNGLVFSLFGGIQKIKLAGAEKRAFAKWAKLFSQEGRLSYNPPLFLKFSTAISAAVTLGGTILLYFVAGENEVSQSDYIAFSTAYGAVSAALLALAGITAQLASIGPLLEMVQPIYDAQPETGENKKQVAELRGEVELSHVTFRYREDLPVVLDDFSLHIKPGEYVGIVGKSGCGKSTLMRLLIGFEKPEAGAVYFDGEDIEELDLRSMRQRIGVDLQNGKLFAGDIFSNITLTAPWSTLDEAWEAARLAGIAEDIGQMPMGMYTMISEGSGGISGGQKQRILIARALAGKPQVLLFDEATSALDNVVQNEVAENIAKLGCTRIVIAHRLSTVKKCDRIVMIDGGRIAEEGTYDELMGKKGLFYEFAARQIK